MKRIHLFEFEDFSWFPSWLRDDLTSLMHVMHRLLNTKEDLVQLLSNLLKNNKDQNILDYCSGNGELMSEVAESLHENGINAKVQLSDLYPNKKSIEEFKQNSEFVTYLNHPVDASKRNEELKGLRTMICSFHHMSETQAKNILLAAQESKQSFCALEISDNSFPKWLWWIAIPINVITCLIITPLVKNLTVRQLIFTYLIPIIPIFFAWDGAVSNARTYTLNDIDELLKGIKTPDYHWKKGILRGKGKKLYLIGSPA